jgi:hypothetical protein
MEYVGTKSAWINLIVASHELAERDREDWLEGKKIEFWPEGLGDPVEAWRNSPLARAGLKILELYEKEFRRMWKKAQY